MNSVSIVIPVRDGKPFIAEAIESGLAQGVAVREVIVIDDGSTDGTPDIVAALSDPRVHLVTNRSGRRGVSVARNDGAALARGEWLVFLDADDSLRPGAVDALLARAGEKTVAVYGDYDRMDAAGRPVGKRGLLRRSRTKPSGAIGEALLAGNFIVNGGVMIVRRKAFDGLGGFDETLRYCEDWHAWCRLALMGEFVYAPVHVLDYRVYDQSVMMTRPLTEAEYGPALAALFSDPLVVAAVPGGRREGLRRRAGAHLNAYAIGQAVRARRFGLAAAGLARTLFDNPRHFPRTLLVSGAALAGI